MYSTKIQVFLILPKDWEQKAKSFIMRSFFQMYERKCVSDSYSLQ